MKLTQNRIVGITAVLIILACFFAIYLRLFTQKELWYEMFAAVLGVIITAIITMILLRGQSDNDVERERASKVFEEKLRIYQEYLQTLYDVIKDGSLSDEEKMQLEFQTSYVAMHCSPCYIASVSTAVKKIIEYTCSEESKEINGGGKSNTPEPLLENLFCVVEAFRKDLYGADFKFDSEHKQTTLLNFSEAYRNAKEGNVKQIDNKQHLVVDLNVLSQNSFAQTTKDDNQSTQSKNTDTQSVESSDMPNRTLWEKAIKKWEAENWIVEDLLSQSNSLRITSNNGNPGTIDLGFYEGHYYIQAIYLGDADFSKPIKWEKGGRRSKGLWWQYLPEPYFSIPEDDFAESFNRNQELQQYIIDCIEQLKDLLTRHHRTAEWKEKVGTYDHWKTFIWYWDMLACEYDNEEEGIPYMDIIEKEKSGKVLVQFANRQCDTEKLRNTLKRMGCEDKKQQEDGYVILEEIPSVKADDVAERVKYWIEKICH